MEYQWHTPSRVRTGHLYRLIPRCVLTFSTLAGQQTQISTDEILLEVTVLAIIPVTKRMPALYELATTLDGERRVFVVSQHNVILQQQRRERQRRHETSPFFA
ncbi:hypothetical protein [Ktedonobacter robiniae]|uniref:Uncharacterized protein n=1 Tax=Ktedonobacter robiniae TaxID=2778365 RepID=A0ABQ3V2N2_9CHLR|nr:hypothetical protein [Ktedonobacter robiniae]GHO59221.1 hypothetical protein KSB_76960 [Ktedonobacter robiniae]